MTGEEWDVDHLVMTKGGRPRGDGDTVTVYRRRIDHLGDKRFHLIDVDPQPARLITVDTPEGGDEGYAKADLDLDTWILARLGRLRVICYDGGAGWDRLLVDLIDDQGEAASEYLMRVCGWPMYEAP